MKNIILLRIYVLGTNFDSIIWYVVDHGGKFKQDSGWWIPSHIETPGAKVSTGVSYCKSVVGRTHFIYFDC